MEDKMNLDVFSSLRDIDVIKFVIADEKDYQRARRVIEEHPEWNAKNVFSPMMKVSKYKYTVFSDGTREDFPIGFDMSWPRQLVEMMIRDKVPAQFSLQIHKILWPGARQER
jgi:organic radical activating enzyme